MTKVASGGKDVKCSFGKYISVVMILGGKDNFVFFLATMVSSVERVVFLMCSLSLRDMVLFAQSIQGLFFVNQGIPKTI